MVAKCHPESLVDCAIVARQWNPRSTYHLYRAPKITTLGTLHAFSDTAEKHRHLASMAVSLSISPDLRLNSASGSYIPFHRLSSSVLPNVRRLALSKDLRWRDYPLIYHKSIAGFFNELSALELSCHFSSVSELFRFMRSFKNVQVIRLHYSGQDPYPPTWMLSPTAIPPLRHKDLLKNPVRLQNLELSVCNHLSEQSLSH